MVKAPGPVPSAKRTTKKRTTAKPATIETSEGPVVDATTLHEDTETVDERGDESVDYVKCEEVVAAEEEAANA